MSDGDRGGVDQAQLKRWIARAALGASVLIGIGGVQHAIYYHDASSHAAHYARDAENQIAAECRIPVAYRECADEIKDAARAQQRDEYDLYSQKAMALWTGVMGAMALFGIALSGVGVLLLWETWKQTGAAADATQRTLNSYIARERAILRLRKAYYCFNNYLVSSDGFIVEVENLGAAPATIEWVDWQYLEGPMWPRERLQMGTYDTTVITKEGATKHLSGKFPECPEFWLAVKIAYRTLRDESFESFAAYRITFRVEDDYGEGGGHFAEQVQIADQPFDT
jgi:hypothetical protein